MLPVIYLKVSFGMMYIEQICNYNVQLASHRPSTSIDENDNRSDFKVLDSTLQVWLLAQTQSNHNTVNLKLITGYCRPCCQYTSHPSLQTSPIHSDAWRSRKGCENRAHSRIWFMIITKVCLENIVCIYSK